MEYAIFSESIDDNLEWAKKDYEIIKREITNRNPDFNKNDRQLVIKYEEFYAFSNEDWILIKANDIAKKYGLNHIEVSKKSNIDQKYFDVSLLLSFDHNYRMEKISTMLGEFNMWKFSDIVVAKHTKPTNVGTALKNILD